MPMTPAEIAAAPRHPQLMNPADPEELIHASVWWYPTLFPHRTAVLQHLLLAGGNEYAWNQAGQICSVFAHIGPDYDSLADRFTSRDDPLGLLDRSDELAALTEIRRTAQTRARTHGPVIMSNGRRSDYNRWGLLAERPPQIDPAWQTLLDEAQAVFAAAWAIQDAAEAGLRRQWDRNPAARAAQLLTRQIGRAWVAGDVTDSELAACDQLLATWRHPGWPSALSHERLAARREDCRAQQAAAREILAKLAAEGHLPARPRKQDAAGRELRSPRDILTSLAADRLKAVSCRVRPVPFTGWLEWEWVVGLLRQQAPAGAR